MRLGYSFCETLKDFPCIAYIQPHEYNKKKKLSYVHLGYTTSLQISLKRNNPHGKLLKY